MSSLTGRIRRAALAGEHKYPGDAGFVQELDASSTFLKKMPERYSFTYSHLERPPQGATPGEMQHLVLHAIRCWLGLLIYSTAWKTRHLVAGVTVGLSEADYFRVMSAARSLVEHSAVLHNTFDRLQPPFRTLRGQTSTRASLTKADAEALLQIWTICLSWAQATKFNWRAGLRGDDAFYSDPDAENTATNVLTLLDKLPQEEKRSARWYYSMLCDFVHPNMASHMLCADHVVRLEGETLSYDLAFRPRSEEALDVVLHVISIPIRQSLGLLRSELQALSEWHKPLEQLLGDA